MTNSGDVIDELDPRSGKVVARYLKGKLLGKGGFAKCYEFTDLDTGKVCACKLIEKKTVTKPKTQQKLKSEIKIHSSLRHHHIVKFERFFEDAENVYILLELCTQQTLMELQKRKRRLSECEAVYLMRQVLEGVKYMHDRNIIHRDLKLGNLFLSENMEVKIGDFGLAAQLEFDGERKLTVCGTPNYIAPEVLDGGKHGHSFEVDIWSLGVILYTLFVGKPPFETNDIKMTYYKIRNTSYAFPEYVDVPPMARRLIQRILQSNPESRPTIGDLMNDPFFAVNDNACPYSLLPLGPQRQLTQEQQLREAHKPKGSPSKAVDCRARDPLKPIVNCITDQRPAALSPHGTAGISPRLFRASTEVVLDRREPEALVRCHSDKEAGRAGREGTSAAVKCATASIDANRASSQPLAPAAPPNLANFPMHQDIVQQKGPDLDEEDKQNLTQMHENLTICIQQRRIEPQEAPACHKPSVWVTEYSDFTAKYGLAYKLSYGHTGAAFNDGTKMIWDSDTNRVEYIARNRDKADKALRTKLQEDRTVCTADDYPESLKKKITLITYFKSYFSKYRGKNVTYPIVQANPATNEYRHQTDHFYVYVKQWMRHSHAMVFRLSNRCFQVSFFDGTDILLSSEAKMVTYTDQKGQSKTFALEMGRIPHADIAERLEYTQKILYQIMHK